MPSVKPPQTSGTLMRHTLTHPPGDYLALLLMRAERLTPRRPISLGGPKWSRPQ